jgi:16S rRNA (uracil1498-N3)-methyltransferase
MSYRYFTKETVSLILEQSYDLEALLDTNDSFHLLKVQRLKNGEMIELVSQGTSYMGSFTSNDKKIRINKTLDSNELNYYLTLIVFLPKGDKVELITMKAVELGMKAIIFVSGDNSVARSISASKLQRLKIIAKEAAMQSKRDLIPEVSFITRFEDLALSTEVYVAAETLAKSPVVKRQQLLKTKEATLIVGPEGGFSKMELALFQKRGYHLVSLGRRILRCETAAITLMSLLMYQGEENA